MEGWSSQGVAFLQSRSADRLDGWGTALLWGCPHSWALFTQSQHLFGHQNPASPSWGKNPWERAFTSAFVTADLSLFLPHFNLGPKNELEILKHPNGEASHPPCMCCPFQNLPCIKQNFAFNFFTGANESPTQPGETGLAFFSPSSSKSPFL